MDIPLLAELVVIDVNDRASRAIGQSDTFADLDQWAGVIDNADLAARGVE